MTTGHPGAGGQGRYDGEPDPYGRRRQQPGDPNAGWQQQQGAEHRYPQQHAGQAQGGDGQYPAAPATGSGQYPYGQQQYGYQGDPSGQYPAVPSQQQGPAATDPGLRPYPGLGVQGYTQGGYPAQGGDPYGYQGGDNPYASQGYNTGQYAAPAYQPQQPAQGGGWAGGHGHGWQAQQQAHTGWEVDPRQAARSRRDDLGFPDATDTARAVGQRGAGQRAAGGARVRRVWPQRLAIAMLIGVAMVACWYWVFPWLENILPSEF